MRRTPLLSSNCALLAILSIALCDTSAPAAAPETSSEVCHQKGGGRLVPITVDGHAAAAHRAHGDIERPNGPAPGGGGFVLDAACNVVSWLYGVNAPLDPSAMKPNATMLAGSGIPATGFGTAHSVNAGIELGIAAVYRQGPSVASTDDYADGLLHFIVNDGPQSTANGSSSNHAGRASWNFNYSIATGLDGTTTDLADHTFQLLYDVDPGPGALYRVLTLEPKSGLPVPGQSGFQWRDPQHGVFIADDAGNIKVTQNSENYAFGLFQTFLASPYGPGNAFSGPARFDIVLQALDGVQIVVRNHVVIDVVP